MLGGEGNENGEKTAIPFFNISLPLFCTTTTWGVQYHFVATSFFSLSNASRRSHRFCGFVLVTRWVHMRNMYNEECCFSSCLHYCFSVNKHEGRVRCLRKQEAIARPFPSVHKQFSSSKFSNVCCHSCCHIVRSSYALTFRLTEKQRYRPFHSGILYWQDWTGLDWTC